MRVKRYTVVVMENGDSFSAMNEKGCRKWVAQYINHVANQDNPWEPHFKMTTEVLESENEKV